MSYFIASWTVKLGAPYLITLVACKSTAGDIVTPICFAAFKRNNSRRLEDAHGR